jgi:glycosyltransferase involved in cell wall biosynthesis
MRTPARSQSPVAGFAAGAEGGKPRLLVVIYARPDFHPPTVNGVRLMDEHFRVRIIHRNDDGPAAEWPADSEIIKVGVPGDQAEKARASVARRLGEYLRFVRAVRRTLREFRPSVIYAYDPLGFAAAMYARGRRAACPPIVFHCHDTPDPARLRFASLQDLMFRYALRRTRDAALVVFPAAYRADYWMSAAGDRRRAVIIPNGAAREFYPGRSDWQTLASRRWAERRILYMGSMGPPNGQAEAIHAMTRLPAEYRLDLIGFASPTFRQDLCRLAASLGVESRVTVDSYLPHRERVRRAEAAAMGLVLYKAVNRNWEHSGSSPNKLFEYAAFGLPVIVPDRPSFRDFFAGDEWVTFADPEDPASIVREIEDVLRDRDRYIAMSLAARRAHEEKYNYERVFAPVMQRLIALAGDAACGGASS